MTLLTELCAFLPGSLRPHFGHKLFVGAKSSRADMRAASSSSHFDLAQLQTTRPGGLSSASSLNDSRRQFSDQAMRRAFAA